MTSKTFRFQGWSSVDQTGVKISLSKWIVLLFNQKRIMPVKRCQCSQTIFSVIYRQQSSGVQVGSCQSKVLSEQSMLAQRYSLRNNQDR